jgi:hypothetical protein
MKYDHARPVRRADVTRTPGAAMAVVPAALAAPGAARPGRSADRAVTELYSLHYHGLVRLAVLLVRDVVKSHTARAMAALRADLERQHRAGKA